jgi:RNA polymerase sigma-70 factor (ECF subfamily)
VNAGVPSDAELCELARAGDIEALAALLERSRPVLYATAVGILRSRPEAEDAVQDACLVALLRLDELRDPSAVTAWLRTVVRNVCRMRLRQRRDVSTSDVEVPDLAPGPDALFEQRILHEWVWGALDRLSEEERITVILRYFTRCASYDSIARVTGVPIGTVRSRLSRARSRLADELLASAAGTSLTHEALEVAQRDAWQDFYREVHERPEPRTYHDLFAHDVDVRDAAGRWHGIADWSAEERGAISIGVRATIVGVVASPDLTVVEVDFTNPAEWPDHCPPHATFVHRVSNGRSAALRIHYPSDDRTPSGPHVVGV